MKISVLIMSVIMLTGCPRKGYEGAQYGLWRAIHIDGDRICFTLDKDDVLESYSFGPNSNVSNKLLYNYITKLSYPDTCFTAHFEKAMIYGARYMINKQWYNYSFIIDNDGQVLDLGGEAVCPYQIVNSL
ncbi:MULTISPECIES: putative T6SS immunity periplasmic lipoprotein [Leclercia]|uniref:putative T6SS immunity periplasmic lipoprotein n=1 Tax=Leclercia TaxID=83654 RepID=UPI00321A0C9F